jgi:hypothetical protein
MLVPNAGLHLGGRCIFAVAPSIGVPYRVEAVHADRGGIDVEDDCRVAMPR